MSVTQGSVPSQAGRITAWNTVVSYASYAEAQTAVDHLVLRDFPPKELEIVGSGLRSVEQVTGRMSWSRAAVSGAAAGAWIGLFIGLLVSWFTTGSTWLGLIIGGLFIGAVWGVAFGLSARWFGAGRHSYSSLRSVVATSYDVIALDGMADRARSVLAQR